VEYPVVVIGGGPAGSAAARVLASCGHSVLLLDKSDQNSHRPRGLAESLPPSARKVLAQSGLLDVVEHAGFYRSTGNTVCWGSGEPRVESFGGTLGFQVFRPAFDRLLLDAARTAGVVVRDAHVRAVETNDDGAVVHYRAGGAPVTVRTRWVVDCSGRAGVVARRYRTPGRRTYALVGEWTTERGFRLPDPTQTFVEACADGWWWSIPTSVSARQAGVMMDGASPRRDGRDLEEAYRAELARSAATGETLRDATLHRVWACDASTYSARTFAGRGFVLAGDAASFLDPLSSAGVKKALASAWLAAVTVNTCLVDPGRSDAALAFFAAWERQVATTQVRRTGEFAVEAAARYRTPFWTARAGDGTPGARMPEAPEDAVSRTAVQAALRAIRESAELGLALNDRLAFERRAVVRGHEIVLEEAVVLPAGGARNVSTPATRFVENVDVVALARLAGGVRSVPDLFEAYCRAHGPASLPNVLHALAWLVAAGALVQRNAVPC
jgi:flavin-dependent halogenase